MVDKSKLSTPVSVEPVVTLNGAQLLQALDFIAPDRDTDPQQLECELTISFADGPAGSGYYCYCTDYPGEGAIMLDAETADDLISSDSDPALSHAALAQQDTEKVDAALAEMVHAMFRSGNSVPVTRITIDRKQYEAAIDAARKEQA